MQLQGKGNPQATREDNCAPKMKTQKRRMHRHRDCKQQRDSTVDSQPVDAPVTVEDVCQLPDRMHLMITAKKVVANRYDVVKRARCCKEQHHKRKRENNLSVVPLYGCIDCVHTNLTYATATASVP